MATNKTWMAWTLGLVMVATLPAQFGGGGGRQRGGEEGQAGSEGRRHRRGQHRKQMKKHLDTDGDGQLSQAERDAGKAKMADRAAERGVTPQFEAMQAARKKMQAARQSGDEAAITAAKAELETARTAMKDAGGMGFREGKQGKRRRHGKFRKRMKEKFDADGDGKLSPEERATAKAARDARAAEGGFTAQVEAQEAARKALKEARQGGDQAAITAAKAQLESATMALKEARKAARQARRSGGDGGQ